MDIDKTNENLGIDKSLLTETEEYQARIKKEEEKRDYRNACIIMLVLFGISAVLGILGFCFRSIGLGALAIFLAFIACGMLCVLATANKP